MDKLFERLPDITGQGLLVARGDRGEVFEITGQGYEAAKRIESP